MVKKTLNPRFIRPSSSACVMYLLNGSLGQQLREVLLIKRTDTIKSGTPPNVQQSVCLIATTGHYIRRGSFFGNVTSYHLLCGSSAFDCRSTLIIIVYVLSSVLPSLRSSIEIKLLLERRNVSAIVHNNAPILILLSRSVQM